MWQLFGVVITVQFPHSVMGKKSLPRNPNNPEKKKNLKKKNNRSKNKKSTWGVEKKSLHPRKLAAGIWKSPKWKGKSSTRFVRVTFR